MTAARYEARTTTEADEDKLLREGLERWRGQKLETIEADMMELNENYRAASEGLAIAHRSPGEVAEDVIEHLWEKLNDSAAALARLEEEHGRLGSMEMPDLIVLVNREAPEPQNAPGPLAATGQAPGLSQVNEIVVAWKTSLQIDLNPDAVRERLQRLTVWQESWRKPSRSLDGT